ncbi:MAG: F0F1 ATP synthase subunit delta [Granulosicoccaceae bacterium]
MADFTTAARPYAKAVFEIAQGAGKFDEWSERLASLASIVEHPEMRQHLDAPNLTHQDRSTIVEKVASDVLDDNGRNFVRLLSENNRLALMGDIGGIFEELRAEAEGEIEAAVTTAFELTDEQRDKMAAALSKKLDRKVRIVTTVDDSLIGGAVIKAGDLVIDGSVKGRLEQMTNSLAS